MIVMPDFVLLVTIGLNYRAVFYIFALILTNYKSLTIQTHYRLDVVRLRK